MDIIKALETLRRLELKVGELYAYFHSLFQGDKEIGGFFFEISLEENSHADLIDYQLRTVKKNKALFNDVEFDIDSLNQLIEKVDSQISLTLKGDVSLEQALKIGIELESNALEYHYRTLIAKANTEMGELVKKLGTADKEHVDKLRTLARAKGIVDN